LLSGGIPISTCFTGYQSFVSSLEIHFLTFSNISSVKGFSVLKLLIINSLTFSFERFSYDKFSLDKICSGVFQLISSIILLPSFIFFAKISAIEPGFLVLGISFLF